MRVGDLVKCRFFYKYGIITKPIEGEEKAVWAWVLWCNGSECRWKTNYLEVVSEGR